MNINLVVLGGINNDKGVLSDFTKKRITKCYKMLDDLKDRNINIHFSGGFNENFNKTNVSHSQLCVNYFEELNQGIKTDVFDLYLKYSESFPYFLSADASKRGIPLTNKSKKVVQRGPITVHRGTSYE